jgi:signal transduction histidine kinase/CheY-like chemotaxis protein
VKKTGEIIWINLTKSVIHGPDGEPLHGLAMVEDITEIKRTQEEALLRQKLESVGTLAGGIAHDFNNLLTIILGNANIARLELPSDSSIRECLSRIEATSLRAADLCKQMLAYSGKGLFLIRRINISKLVEEMSDLLQLSVAKKVTLQFQLDSSLPAVLADSTQLQQILMNLVTNASEAIGDRDGVICIRSTLAQVDRKSLRDLSPATNIADGKYVLLEVTDNGSGMSPEIRERIFDPFFSTKFAGRGLGLAAVLGIVRSHRGAISVHSEVGRGSSFKLFLPPVEGLPEEEAPSLEPTSDWKGRGTILLAEDEEGVRVTTADLLRAGGFSVDVAESGRTAIDKFRMAPQRYKAILLDFAMPDGDGAEAFHEIRAIQPQAIILVMSGYDPQHVLERFKGKGLNGFIQKPFQADSLMAAIRKALEVGNAPRA